jgi:hypothetical protein
VVGGAEYVGCGAVYVGTGGVYVGTGAWVLLGGRDGYVG